MLGVWTYTYTYYGKNGKREKGTGKMGREREAKVGYFYLRLEILFLDLQELSAS
jgi:hypothetical protein